MTTPRKEKSAVEIAKLMRDNPNDGCVKNYAITQISVLRDAVLDAHRLLGEEYKVGWDEFRKLWLARFGSDSDGNEVTTAEGEGK